MSSKFCALLIFLLPLISWSQTSYVVKPGDTILKVADRSLRNKDPKNPKRYELARKIRQMNPRLKDPNTLEPGQTLLIPSPTSVAKTGAEQPPISEPAKQSAPTPAPTPTPVVIAELAPKHEAITHPATEESKPHESAHSNFIFLQPRYQMLEITSQDLATKTKASMKSQASFGLDLQYGVILNHHWHLLFQAGITQTQFEKIEGVGASVNHTSETLKSFAAGVAYEATPRLHLDLMLMAAERTFLLPAVLPKYELKAIMVPAAELNVSYDFYAGTSNLFGISAIGEYLAKVEKDSVQYKSALETFGALYWKSKYGSDRTNYKVTVTYKHGHQDTSLTQQNEDVTTLGLGFYF